MLYHIILIKLIVADQTVSLSWNVPVDTGPQPDSKEQICPLSQTFILLVPRQHRMGLFVREQFQNRRASNQPPKDLMALNIHSILSCRSQSPALRLSSVIWAWARSIRGGAVQAVALRDDDGWKMPASGAAWIIQTGKGRSSTALAEDVSLPCYGRAGSPGQRSGS